MPFRRLLGKLFLWACCGVMLQLTLGGSLRADDTASFLRGINLNGPALTIAGRDWQAGGPDLGQGRFEKQSVPLIPPTDPARSQMIRSSVWDGGGQNRLVLKDLPPGPLTVYLYVWEDNNTETYSVFVNGTQVLTDFQSGAEGEWRRLGPWIAEARDGVLELSSRGGAANWSGIELWRGRLQRHPDDPVVPPRMRPQPLTPATPVQKHFDTVIAPLLAQHCIECHNPSEKRGDLDLTTAAGAANVLVAGQPADSLLWLQVESGEMPKKRPALAASEQKLLRDWITQGAHWGSQPVDLFAKSTLRRAGYDWWSLQPVQQPQLPPVQNQNWPQTAADRFILAQLETRQLQPSPPADPRTLIRRLAFDLTGLPPTSAEVLEFTAQPDEAAYTALVDRYLASPQFGEHWARHWLDVIRFGESQGFERNKVRENAWRFRDWVIDAYNADLPYDEFVKRQIAGDVLYPQDLSALIATGYHVCGTWDQVGHFEGSAAMRRVAREDHLEDLVGTLGQAFLGLSVQCARCHDHKFDPISQREYYQLAAALGGVRQLVAERDGITLAATEQQRDFKGLAHVIRPEQPPLFHVLLRGNVTRPGDVVAPEGLIALRGVEQCWELDPQAPEGQRRQKLAEWLTDRRNPLTARVYVNRVWQSLFGTGLVETPSEFGFQGGQPSHPELLDHLAHRFMEEGWRVKPLIRELVSSVTYRQQSAVAQPAALEVDAGARLRWQAPLRRLTGEEVRDALLSVSGALNPAQGGPSFRDVQVKIGSNNNDEFTTPIEDFTPETCRRTIYRLWARSGGQPLLTNFDCPDPSVSAPRRMSTITPLQALSLLNSSFAVNCAQRLAQQVQQATSAEDSPAAIAQQVTALYDRVLLRSPTTAEAARATSFVQAHGLEQLALVLFNTNEFLFVR